MTVLLFAGCSLRRWVENGFLVGPNYAPPPEPVAVNWIDYQDPRLRSEEEALVEWWRVFDDPDLNQLIEAAYNQNLTLRVAGARILEARAIRGVAVGNLFPQLQEAAGSYTRNKLSQKTALIPPQAWFSEWDAGFNLAWELDFWGRFRRAIEAADAELDASVANYDDVLVILLADVASNYIQLRTFQKRLELAYRNLFEQRGSLQIAIDRHKLGATTERDVRQAETLVEQTKALIPLLETGIRVANNRLCVLLGMPPRELTELGVGEYERRLRQEWSQWKSADQVPPAPGRIPLAPPVVAVGVPADLVRRRPDVRRAERQLAAQSARIGIAESDFYPRISILGGLGVQAEHFADLFDTPESMAAFVGPSFRWNILNYGRILNQVRAEDARFQQLLFAYQDTVLNAAREAEDALYSFLRNQERAESLGRAVEAARRTVDITYDQYREGAVDYTAVFLFEGELTRQQDALAVAQGDIALSLVEAFRALGGGWEMRRTRGCGGQVPPPVVDADAEPLPPPQPLSNEPKPMEQSSESPAAKPQPVRIASPYHPQ